MNIYVIGDSISIQYGPYLEGFLNGVMGYARKSGEEEANRNLDQPEGANGGDSARVLSYLKECARSDAIRADLILVNCGLHDIKTDPSTGDKQVPLPRYEENLRAIIETIAAMGTQMIWIRTTPCDERVHNHADMEFHRFAADNTAYNAAADRIMDAAGIPVIDLYTFTCNLGKDLYCDHVHFHEPIRELQAAYIAGWLDCISHRKQQKQG